MLSKKESLELMQEKVSNDKLRKHMYAVSDIMKAVAEDMGKDEELWEKTGLLHDIDYDKTKKTPEKHGEVSAQILEGEVPKKVIKAVKSHNHEHTDVKPSKDIEHCLIASDAISGIIVATALVMPDSKLEQVKVSSVIKKIDDSSFAKSIDRSKIKKCGEIGLEIKRFVEVALNAVKKDSERLGL